MSSIFNIRPRFQSSIYGQVVIIITILSIFLFMSIGIIFRSVNQEYLNNVIQENGNNIGSIVEGALYHSMLENDKGALQNTLDVINNLPGIEDVNMYDKDDNLVYSSVTLGEDEHGDPDCKSCHLEIKDMFPRTEKSFRIVNLDTECQMSSKDYDYRLLMIRYPILNQRSCYTADCHAHTPNEEVLGAFVMRIPLEGLDSAIYRSSTDFFLLAALTTVLLLAALIIFTRLNIKRPLVNIIKASEAVSKGDRSTRLELKANQLSDIKMVSNAFNKMLDSIEDANRELENWSKQLEYKVQKKTEELSEIQSELIHVERIATLGKLSSSVAHEINNPLSGVLTYTKLIQKQLNKPSISERTKKSALKYLKVIELETKRCGNIVKGLLDFSRKDQQNFETKHLHGILKETFELMAHQLKIAEIRFNLDLSAKWDLINCNDNQIKQACIAILLNASEAITENGEIIMRTSNPDAENILLDIKDNGAGIAPEDLPHIFEPFFSAKQKDTGIGLGLTIVHGIVINHGGKVYATSDYGKRTTVSIMLPIIKD